MRTEIDRLVNFGTIRLAYAYSSFSICIAVSFFGTTGDQKFMERRPGCNLISVLLMTDKIIFTRPPESQIVHTAAVNEVQYILTEKGKNQIKEKK